MRGLQRSTYRHLQLCGSFNVARMRGLQQSFEDFRSAYMPFQCSPHARVATGRGIVLEKTMVDFQCSPHARVATRWPCPAVRSWRFQCSPHARVATIVEVLLRTFRTFNVARMRGLQRDKQATATNNDNFQCSPHARVATPSFIALMSGLNSFQCSPHARVATFAIAPADVPLDLSM